MEKMRAPIESVRNYQLDNRETIYEEVSTKSTTGEANECDIGTTQFI